MDMFDVNESSTSIINRMNEAFSSNTLIKPKGSTEHIIPGTFHLNKYNEVVIKLPDGRFATTQDIKNNIIKVRCSQKMKDQNGSPIYWTTTEDGTSSLQCPDNIQDALFAHGYIDNELYNENWVDYAFKYVTYDKDKNRIWKTRKWTPGVPEYDVKRKLALEWGIAKNHSCCYCNTTDVSLFNALHLMKQVPKLQTACRECNNKKSTKPKKCKEVAVVEPPSNFGDPLLQTKDDIINYIESHDKTKLKRMNGAFDSRIPGNCYLNKYNIPSILCSDGRLLTAECIKNNALQLNTFPVRQQGSHYVYWALNDTKTETVNMPSDLKNAVVDHVYKQGNRFYFRNVLGEKKEKRPTHGVPEYDNKLSDLQVSSEGHSCSKCGETNMNSFHLSSSGNFPALHRYCNACQRLYDIEWLKNRSLHDFAIHIARNAIKSNEKRRTWMKNGKLRAETIVHMQNEWLEWFSDMIHEELNLFVSNGNIPELASIDRINEDLAYAWETVSNDGTVLREKNFRIITKREQTRNGIGFTENKHKTCSENAKNFSTNDYPPPSRELVIAVNEVRQIREAGKFSSYSTELSRNIGWFVKQSRKAMISHSNQRNKRKFTEYNEEVSDNIADVMLDKILSQGGVCSVSRIPMSFDKNTSDWKASVDREDSKTGGGYVASNINIRCLEFQPEFKLPSYIVGNDVSQQCRWTRELFLQVYSD